MRLFLGLGLSAIRFNSHPHKIKKPTI
jgi:hypothetical protein